MPEQWCSALQLPLKALGMCWWDKDESQSFNLHVEGWDRAQWGKIKEKNPITESNLIIEKRKNIVALRTLIVTKFKRNIYIYIYISKNYSPQTWPTKNVFIQTCFFIVFLAFSLSLVHCERYPIHWSLVFSSLSTNSLYWALWALIHLPFGLRIQNPLLQWP